MNESHADVISKDFSKREAIRYGWEMVKEHLGLLVGATAVLLLLSLAFGALSDTIDAVVLSILVAIVSWIIQSLFSLGYIYIGIRLYRGEPTSLQDMVAPVEHIWNYIAASIIYGLIVLVGLILLIVPGIIWGIKYSLFAYAIVDEGAGPIEAIKRSGEITYDAKWNLFLLSVILGLLSFVGLLLFGLGLLITAPLSLMATTSVYFILLEATGS